MKLDAKITVTPQVVRQALEEVSGGDPATLEALNSQLNVDSFAPFETSVPATALSNPAQLLAFLISSLATAKKVEMDEMPGAAKATQPAPTSAPSPGRRARRTYGKDISGVKTADDIVSRAPQFESIVKGMVELDVNAILGTSPQDVRTRFDLGAEWSDARIESFMAAAKSRLDFATERVTRHIGDAELRDVEWSKLSASDKQKVVGQHSNYVAGILERDWNIDKQAARGVLQLFLENGDSSAGARTVLADQLSRLGPGEKAEEIHAWVQQSNQDWMFHPDSARGDSAVLKNLASEYAGAAIVALAEEVAGDPAGAPGLLNQIFRRSDYELAEQLRNARGPEGMLLHLAATANHLAWGTATLGLAKVDAENGKEGAVKKWKHTDLRPSWIVISEDASSAPKLVDQLEAFMLSSKMMIPRDRSTHQGEISQMEILDNVFDAGVYANDHDATISLNARRVTDVAIDKLTRYGSLSQLYAGAGAQATAEVVAEIAATFAAKATGSTEAELNDLKRLYYEPLTALMPEVLKLFEMRHKAESMPEDARNKVMADFDERYSQLYSTFAGQVGFDALAKHIGEADAQDTARSTGLIDLSYSAAHNLRMDVPPEYLQDPSKIAEDFGVLADTLMKDDYFLGQDDFIANAQEDAGKKLPAAKRDTFSGHVEHAARLPNAVWFFVSLVRGLVQPERLKRFESAGLHSDPEILTSDSFPDALQFNMPDVRDIDLFHWAKHRLQRYHGKNEPEAQRLAFSVVVLTLYKDLIQIQKGAGVR